MEPTNTTNSSHLQQQETSQVSFASDYTPTYPVYISWDTYPVSQNAPVIPKQPLWGGRMDTDIVALWKLPHKTNWCVFPRCFSSVY